MTLNLRQAVLSFIIFNLVIIIISQAAPAALADSRDVIVINNLSLNKKTKEIRLKVRLSLTKGILEYLLVGDQGKAYESTFKVSDNLPSELNFALLLIGCEPLAFNKYVSLLKMKNGLEILSTEHRSSLVEITIEQNGKPVDSSSLIKTREKQSKKMTWVVTGGRFQKNKKFSGDLALSFIGIWPDQTAVINLFSNTRNPYRGDFGFEINTNNKSLAEDQAFDLVIRRVKQ